MSDIVWDGNDRPLAYFITFRTHGTWLHGDQRGAVDRHGRNIYGSERIGLDPVFSVTMDRNMSTKPVILDARRRSIVDSAIREMCSFRGYNLRAINVRTNHGHAVISADAEAKAVLGAVKANATRALREAGLLGSDEKVWSRGGSTRFLWKQHQVDAAIDYTLNGQGAELPKF